MGWRATGNNIGRDPGNINGKLDLWDHRWNCGRDCFRLPMGKSGNEKNKSIIEKKNFDRIYWIKRINRI